MLRPVRWLVYILVIGAALMLVVAGQGLNAFGLKSDWLAFYTAGSFLLDGQASRLYDLAAIQAWQSQYIGQSITAFLYPPVYAAVLVPLAALPIWPARVVWLVLGVMAGVYSARTSTSWSKLSLPFSLLALLAFPPLVFSLVVGQASPITLLIFSAVVHAERRQKQGIGVGMLAGMALYKPQLLIPLGVYWLFRRRWRSLLGLGLVALLVAGLSCLISVEASLAYLQMSWHFYELAEAANQSGANAAIFAYAPWMGVLVSALALAALAFSKKTPPGPSTQALLWLAPMLVTPYLATYDLLLAILPLSLAAPILAGKPWMSAVVALLFLSTYLAIPLYTVRPVLWVCLGLFAMLWLVDQRPDAPGADCQDGHA